MAQDRLWKRKLMVSSIREALLAGKSVVLVSPNEKSAKKQLKDLLEDDLIKQIDFKELPTEGDSRL